MQNGMLYLSEIDEHHVRDALMSTGMKKISFTPVWNLLEIIDSSKITEFSKNYPTRSIPEFHCMGQSSTSVENVVGY